MNRLAVTAGGALMTIAVVACGSATASTATSTPSPTGGRGLGRGTAGQLVQINGSTLIVSNQNGDTPVTYSTTTAFTQTSTATVGDITSGTCIVAAGTKDASGGVTIDTVRVSEPLNGVCTGLGGFGGGGGGTRTPNPNRTPPPQFANRASVRGMVTNVSGTTVTVQAAGGTTQTVTVPTTVRVTRSDQVQPSTLRTGDCVLAVGPKAAGGTVSARSISIVPAGPNGCFSGGGSGFGGGGFGGFGGGGGGSEGGGTGNTTT